MWISVWPSRTFPICRVYIHRSLLNRRLLGRLNYFWNYLVAKGLLHAIFRLVSNESATVKELTFGDRQGPEWTELLLVLDQNRHFYNDSGPSRAYTQWYQGNTWQAANRLWQSWGNLDSCSSSRLKGTSICFLDRTATHSSNGWLPSFNNMYFSVFLLLNQRVDNLSSLPIRDCLVWDHLNFNWNTN